MTKQKIVLAYSGGLDTSVAIPWLQEHYGYDVVALVADLGEGKDLKEIKEKALKLGAIKCHVIDVKKRFSEKYIAKVIKSNAMYENIYPLISAISRPLIAKLLVDIANSENATAIAHGCTGKGNDQVRFDIAAKSLSPDLTIIAPVRENPMSREAAISYANGKGISLGLTKENPFSIDLNLWGRSCECAVLEDPWTEPPENAYAMTKALHETPDNPITMKISFKQGLPVMIDDNPMPLDQIIMSLNEVAGAHGVGRIDHVENRLIGIKSREIYEAPAALTLINAHKALETLCLTRDTLHFKYSIENKISQLIYDGKWYSPLFSALTAFIDNTQKNVSGDVMIKLHKGQVNIIGRQSKHSLYQYNLATYRDIDEFNHDAAKGFIEIWGMPSIIHSQVNGIDEE